MFVCVPWDNCHKTFELQHAEQNRFNFRATAILNNINIKTLHQILSMSMKISFNLNGRSYHFDK